VELTMLQLPIGDGGVIEQQCSAGMQTHGWLLPKQTDHQNWLTIIPESGIINFMGKNWNPDNYRFFPIFPNSPITPDNSQFFPRGLPNNRISLGGIPFYFWSFSAKCQIPDILRSVPGTPCKMSESVIFGTLFFENVSCQIPWAHRQDQDR
jgi:hypothetical protein